VNLKTAASYFHRLREIIAFAPEAESEAMFVGEIEVDESYFGGKVNTKIIPDASSAILMPIIERKIVPDSIVDSDGWRGYNVLDLSPLPDQSQQALRGQSEPHQRYLEFLEPGAAPIP
jgi:transposase